MGDLNKKYSKFDFIIKLRDNGWIAKDEEVPAFEELYDLIEKNDKLDALDAQLMLMTKKDGWSEKQRLSILNQLDNTIMQYVKDGVLKEEDIKAYNSAKDGMTKYKSTELLQRNEFWIKERSKVIEAEDNRLRKSYIAKIENNNKSFDDKYGMNKEAFIEKAKANGWVMPADYMVMEYMYVLCRNSAYPEMLELFDKVLNTSLKSVQERNKMAVEIYNVSKKMDKLVRGKDFTTLENLKYRLDRNAKEKKYNECLESYKKNKQIDENQIKYQNALIANGWDQVSAHKLGTVYYRLSNALSEYNIQPDEAMAILTSKKIDKNNPASDIYQLLDKFSAKLNENKNVEKYKLKFSEAVKNIKKAYKEQYSKEQLKIKKEEFDADKKALKNNKPVSDKKKDAEDILNNKNTENLAEKAIKKEKIDEKKKIADEKKAKIQEEAGIAFPLVKKSQLVKNAKDMYNMIKKVDFNLFGKGSTQFNEMRDALKEWKEFAETNLFEGNNGYTSSTDLAKYLDMQKKCLNKVRTYVDYKKGQLLNNPDRVNDGKKQAHEQPRVSAALSVLDTMEHTYAYGEFALVATMQSSCIPPLQEQLKKETETIKKGNFISDEELEKITADAKGNEKALNKNKETTIKNNYYRAVGKAGDILYKLNGDSWSLKPDETHESYVTRTSQLGDMEVYEDINVLDETIIHAKNHPTRNLLRQAQAMYKGGEYNTVQYKGGEMFTSIKDIKKIVKDTAKKNGRKYVELDDIKMPDAKATSQNVHNEVAGLRENMISQTQKAKEEAEKQAAANKKVVKAGGGMKK